MQTITVNPKKKGLFNSNEFPLEGCFDEKLAEGRWESKKNPAMNGFKELWRPGFQQKSKDPQKIDFPESKVIIFACPIGGGRPMQEANPCNFLRVKLISTWPCP